MFVSVDCPQCASKRMSFDAGFAMYECGSVWRPTGTARPGPWLSPSATCVGRRMGQMHRMFDFPVSPLSTQPITAQLCEALGMERYAPGGGTVQAFRGQGQHVVIIYDAFGQQAPQVSIEGYGIAKTAGFLVCLIAMWRAFMQEPADGAAEESCEESREEGRVASVCAAGGDSASGANAAGLA